MFERFTDDGRQAVELAQDEARGLGHPHVGTEHLLLGLLRLDRGRAADVLEELCLNLEAARAGAAHHRRCRGSGARPDSVHPRVRKVLDLAVREAKSLGSTEVDTEHVLLAIRGEGEGVGAEVLHRFTIHPAQIREQLGLL